FQLFNATQIRGSRLARFTGLLVRNSSEDIGEDELAIGGDTDLSRIIFANLAWFYVDLDQLGVWNGKSDTFAIRRGRPIGKAAAQRHQNVSVRRRLIPRQRSRPTCGARAHGVVFGTCALAIPGENHGN